MNHVDALPEKARHRVIIVEDEDVVLKTLVRLLGRTYEVQGASSLSEAESLIRISAPCAVVCDLHLGDAGPQGIVASLTSMSLSRRTVFMSGGAFADGDEYSFGKLPGPLLRKPFDPTALREILAQVIDQS
ncbi:MAG: ActR/RegA family two-component response regulator [Cognaticolwellia sp.]|jgi:ActR/RegA family two-component response regulator